MRTTLELLACSIIGSARGFATGLLFVIKYKNCRVFRSPIRAISMLVKEDGQTLPEMERLSDDEGQEARHRVGTLNW